MPNTISGFPYAELQFTKDGLVFNADEISGLQRMLKEQSISDLFVVSHGWNNDMNDARQLYTALTAKLFKALSGQMQTKKFGVLGILWPSKKFAEKDLIAGGGAASVGAQFSEEDKRLLTDGLKNLDGFFDNPEADKILADAGKLANSMQNDKTAAATFVQQMSKLFKEGVASADVQVKEDVTHEFSQVTPGDLLMELECIGEEDEFAGLPKPGGAAGFQGMGNIQGAGSAAGLGSFAGNIFAGARNLLNFVTYYQMKERAGKVGLNGLHPILQQLTTDFPDLRLHMIGHSFGGRLVTAATAGKPGSTLKVDSLILLQAAFSHYGFAQKYDGKTDGFFRSVVSDQKVKGVIMITYTHNDSAVGLAYAIASRIARQVGVSIGDKDDKYGGMGGNGAQLTPGANNKFHLAKEINYSFEKGNLYNVNGDGHIMNHSDIAKTEVARAIAAAVSV